MSSPGLKQTWALRRNRFAVEEKANEMGRINFARIILGGLVTGLVINVGEFLLNEVIFVKQMEEMVRRLNITRPGAAFIGAAVVLTFLLGIVIVLVYALIRTRLGPGPKSALVAGLVGWFCVYFYAGILNGTLFGVPPTLMLIGLAWGLGEYLIGAVAGAWVYKES